jgi:hypothetical protein
MALFAWGTLNSINWDQIMPGGPIMVLVSDLTD